ncbi:MAG TPA: efflux RND transporter periplasmic adaptor subunit [Burkholderiales bacterium]|nr:efflux RND transporter periplasmic adaptor subunit [Burkholderiales bacterium]
MSHRKHLILAATALAAIVAVAAAYFAFRPDVPEGILDANGQVRGTEVTLSAKVPGIAEVIAVKEGQLVKRGELLAQIGARDIEARLAQATAEREAAKARLPELAAQIAAVDTAIEQSGLGADLARGTTEHEIHGATEAVGRADAELKVAEAQWEQDQRLQERYAGLAAQGYVSQSYYDDIRTRHRASESRLQAARKAREEAVAASQRAQAGSLAVDVKRKDVQRLRAERDRLVASRGTLERQTEAAAARVTEIEATLADMRIVAPADGTVINRLAEPGELVAAGRPIATLIDLSALYVRVFIPEREIAKVRLGNPARIYADAFPQDFFSGRVTEVAQRAEFTPKEAHMKDEREKLVFGVKVAIENPQGHLKPGMPVDVKIKWQDEAAW